MKEGWEYKKLGDTLFFDKRFQGLNGCKQEKIVSFSHVSAEELKNLVDENGDVRLLSTGNFSGYTTKEKAGSSLNCGEVITIPTGGTANIKYYNGLFVDSGNIIGIASNASIVLRFIYYAMIANNDTINSYYRGASIKHPYMPDIYKIPIPVPSKIEQQRIVDELDLLSSIIEKKNVQLNELDNLAQSLFYEMFGDPIANEKRWEVMKLEDACTCITDGDHMPPPKVDEGIPFITISNIDKQSREIDFRETFFVPQNYYDNIKEERKAQIGDVLYTVTGSYGIPIIVSENRKFCFQRHIALLRPNKLLVSSCFLCYWALCKSIKYIADDVATGIAQKTVGLSSLRKFPIIIPPLDLQNQYASKIEAIEHQKKLIKQSIKEVETLFNSRMDFYFN